MVEYVLDWEKLAQTPQHNPQLIPWDYCLLGETTMSMLHTTCHTYDNKQCCSISISSVTMYYSYSTLIAVCGYDAEGTRVAKRHENRFSNTTARHFSAMDCNYKNTATEDELHQFLTDLLTDQLINTNENLHMIRSQLKKAA